MKSVLVCAVRLWVRSHPVRGAWIEIVKAQIDWLKQRSHPVRGAWIEISPSVSHLRTIGSHPVRGAWIEIRRETCQCEP